MLAVDKELIDTRADQVSGCTQAHIWHKYFLGLPTCQQPIWAPELYMYSLVLACIAKQHDQHSRCAFQADTMKSMSNCLTGEPMQLQPLYALDAVLMQAQYLQHWEQRRGLRQC